MKRDGWQCWVDIRKDSVFKKLKTEGEIKEKIIPYVNYIKQPEKLEKLTKSMLKAINESMSIIKNSKIPKKLFCNPKWIDRESLTQDRAEVIEDLLARYSKSGDIDSAKSLIDKCVRFYPKMWKYGLHETTFKFHSNFGLLEGDVVLIDLFELTEDYEKVKKRIEEKAWQKFNDGRYKINLVFAEYFTREMDKKITVKKLEEVWGEKMKIIDCHTHLPIVGREKNLKKSFEEYKKNMARNNITFSILIPDNAHDSLIGDTEENLKLIKDSENIFLLGTIDIRYQGKNWIKKLDLLLKQKKIKGIKIFPGHDPIYPTDKRLFPIYELCLKHDCPIVIHTGANENANLEVMKYNDPKYIIKIAKKYPNLKIIISHFFNPKIEYCYRITREFENIYFDTSALADDEVLEITGKENIIKILKKVMRDNPERLLFGSDYNCCPSKKHIDLINSLNISEKEREMVFWKNTARLFKLK